MKRPLVPEITQGHEDLSSVKRVNALRRHLEAADIKWINSLYKEVNYIGNYDQYFIFIAGIKPALAISDREYLSGLKPLIPKELDNLIMKTSNGWSINKAMVRNIIKTNKKYFYDFDFSKINSDAYLRTFIESMSTLEDIPRDKTRQTGLLLGFQKDSAVSFSEDDLQHNFITFDSHGYQFGVLKSKKKKFEADLIRRYKKSGLFKLDKDLKRSWRSEFKARVKRDKDSFEIIEINDDHFLEVTSSDLEKETIVRQFIYINKDLKSAANLNSFLQAMSDRFKLLYLEPMQPSLHSGVAYFDYFDDLRERDEQDSIFYYRFEESADEISMPRLFVVNYISLLDYLAEEKPRVVKKFKKLLKKKK